MSRDLSSLLPISDFDFGQYRVAIVQSTYHNEVTDSLKEGAIQMLQAHHIGEIYHIEVPGAYELVYGCQQAISYFSYLHGIITLGCVIKGDTDHDVYINHAVANGLMQLQIKHDIPIGFGLLTTNNLVQAIDRAGGKHGNKGEEVASAVLHSIASKINKI